MTDPENLYGETETIHLADGEEVEVDLGVLQAELDEKPDCIIWDCEEDPSEDRNLLLGDTRLDVGVCLEHDWEAAEAEDYTAYGLDLPIWRFWTEEDDDD